MAGRQPSSYVFPRLWHHIEVLGYARSVRALKKLRYIEGFKSPFGTMFSNRLLETKFVPERPVLLDYNTAHDLVSLIGHHLRTEGKAPVSAHRELVRFDCRVSGLQAILGARLSEHADPLGEIAVRADLTEDVVRQAANGRLLPHQICMAIVAAASGTCNLAVTQDVPGRGSVPCNGHENIRVVLAKLVA